MRIGRNYNTINHNRPGAGLGYLMRGGNMETERAIEILKHFKTHGIDKSTKGMELVCEYQDCIMRSNQDEIFDFYNKLNKPEIELFHWANFSTLSMDSALGILIQTAGKKMRRGYINQAEKIIEQETAEADKKWSMYVECKRAISRKIRKLTETAEANATRARWAEHKNDITLKENTRLIAHNRQLQDKADKYDKLRALLSD